MTAKRVADIPKAGTPGPWGLYENEHDDGWAVYGLAPGLDREPVIYEDAGVERVEDARAIAALPELRDLAERLEEATALAVEALEHPDDIDRTVSLARIRAITEALDA